MSRSYINFIESRSKETLQI